MMRRYEDAIKVFVDALIYIQRTRTMLQAPTRSLLNDMVYFLMRFFFILLKFEIFSIQLDHKTKRTNISFACDCS
jgi:hypothetical protein